MLIAAGSNVEMNWERGRSPPEVWPGMEKLRVRKVASSVPFLNCRRITGSVLSEGCRSSNAIAEA